ncbi:hypothetical protein GH714_013334 [Hevea brasiliensis]|uniref:Uncharacterized protein n=1 Tax=Hevea brasiliensis TaxID=3981 RepID=A0A6A6KBQ7_HEVBR|nr:hypothetical protein GH714_013334 [Hevea brasiliensis]
MNLCCLRDWWPKELGPMATNPHPTLTIPIARVEIPKPSPFKGARSARVKNFHSLKEDQRVGPSDALREDGEQDNGMGDAAKEKDTEECATQEESELPRELPPEEQVGCVSEPPVARSPKEVALPKQEGTRQHHSRRSKE